MGQRLKLHSILKLLLGLTNVYYQPPASIILKYPCIVYETAYSNTAFADDMLYRSIKGYSLTVIDADPDSIIPEKVSKLPMCKFDRHFTANNLNHGVYIIYF